MKKVWMPPHHHVKGLATPAHILFGLFCAAVYIFYPPLSITLFISFGFYEWFEASIIHDKGHKDFWEGFLAYCIGAGIIILLELTEVI